MKFKRLGIPPLKTGHVATIPNRTLLFAFGTVAEQTIRDLDSKEYKIKRIGQTDSTITRTK